MATGVKGMHIAERDSQWADIPKQADEFVNTWSIEGFFSEGLQPAELGWGTHEKQVPPEASFHEHGCKAAIYLTRPGAEHGCAVGRPRPGRIRLPDHAQRVDLHRRLPDSREMARRSLPTHGALRLSPRDDTILAARVCGTQYAPASRVRR